MSGATSVELPDGTVVQVRISDAGTATQPDMPGNVGFGRAAVTKLAGLDDTIRGVARSVREATKGLAPDEVAVHFGIELSAATGPVLSLLAEGETRTHLKVVLTWHNGVAEPDEDEDQG